MCSRFQHPLSHAYMGTKASWGVRNPLSLPLLWIRIRSLSAEFFLPLIDAVLIAAVSVILLFPVTISPFPPLLPRLLLHVIYIVLYCFVGPLPSSPLFCLFTLFVILLHPSIMHSALWRIPVLRKSAGRTSVVSLYISELKLAFRCLVVASCPTCVRTLVVPHSPRRP